jgi:hypothetical protein
MFALGALAGCGSNNEARTDGSGRLRDVEISPLPGATFLPRTSEFTIFWSSGFEPPPTFFARVYRLRPDESIEELSSNLAREGSEFRWYLRPTGDLPPYSAIYVELSAPGETSLRFAYIIGNTRSAVPSNPIRSGGVTARRHTIRTR